MTTKIKYEEGRAAALGRLQRLFGECGDISPAVEYFVLREEAAYWRRLLLQHGDADIPALPWLAYSRGGLDAVEAVWADSSRGAATTSATTSATASAVAAATAAP